MRRWILDHASASVFSITFIRKPFSADYPKMIYWPCPLKTIFKDVLTTSTEKAEFETAEAARSTPATRVPGPKFGSQVSQRLVR